MADDRDDVPRHDRRHDDDFHGYVRGTLDAILREQRAMRRESREDVQRIYERIDETDKRTSGRIAGVHQRIDATDNRVNAVEAKAAKTAAWAGVIGLVLGALAEYLWSLLTGRPGVKP